jgi:hypothetical protein
VQDKIQGWLRSDALKKSVDGPPNAAELFTIACRAVRKKGQSRLE